MARSGSVKTSCTPSTVQVECLILSRFEPSIHVHAIESYVLQGDNYAHCVSWLEAIINIKTTYIAHIQ